MNSKKYKESGCSLSVIALVIAIVVVFNILFEILPGTFTQFDMSANKLYSISSNTKAVVNNLHEDVTIYWVTQSGKEDTIIRNLLNKYDALSDRVTVIKRDPDIYPTFAQQYTDGTVGNNDLIVESAKRFRYIPNNEIYEKDLVDSSTMTYDYYFDGEGEVTSAIDYVVRDTMPKLYNLTGHGEQPLTKKFKNALEKANIEFEDFTLLAYNGVPEDADAFIMHSPTSDISEKEAQMIIDYFEDKGKMFIIAGPGTGEDMTNLYSVLEYFDVHPQAGAVIESDGVHSAFSQPYILVPNFGTDTIVNELHEGGYHVILPIAMGLVADDYNNGAYVKPLLKSSDTAYSKTHLFEGVTTYDYEPGDIPGPFDLCERITKNNQGEIIWVTTNFLLDDTYNSYSAGANTDFAINCIEDLLGSQDNISIRTKSMNYEYLTITDQQASFIKTVMIGVIPAIFVVFGVVEVIGRRKKR